MHTEFWWEKLTGGHLIEDFGFYDMITVKWI